MKVNRTHWCRSQGCRGCNGSPKILIWWKSGRNHIKSGQNLWKPSKTPWKSEQKWRPTWFHLKIVAPELTCKAFFGRHFFEIFFGKVCEIRAKFPRSPKNLLALAHMIEHTFEHFWEDTCTTLFKVCCRKSSFSYQLRSQSHIYYRQDIFVIYAVSFEASAFACSLARRFGFVLFVAVGSAQFFHCSLEVVYFLWTCVGLSTFHTC